MIKLDSKNYSSVEKMLSKFKRKVRESRRIIEQVERKHHIKKSDKKRLKLKKQNQRKLKEKNNY